MTTQIKRTAAIYGRVSSQNQENEGTIHTQLSAVNDLVASLDLAVISRYLDEGWSGDRLDRPALDQLRIDAKKKMWEVLVVYDPDRLARRYSYQELIMDELRETGIEVVFVTTPTPKTGEDKILMGVKGLFAEYERAKIAERFRLGKVRKARDGHMITTEAPYGLKWIKKNGRAGDSDFHQGYCEVDDSEMPVLKMMFEWADSGVSIRGIVKRLQELEIPPRKSKRGVWSTSTITTMLRNTTYIGKSYYGRSEAKAPINPIKNQEYRKNKKSSRKMRDESEWIMIPSPIVIDPELFERVQNRLSTNRASIHKKAKYEYLLSGKVWCPCGRKRNSCTHQKGKHLYYRCNDRIYTFPLPQTCEEQSLIVGETDNAVWAAVSEMMTSPELLQDQLDRWIAKQQVNPTESSEVGIHIGQIEKEIAKLQEQEQRFAAAYGQGTITLEKFQEYINPILQRTQLLKEQVHKAQQSVKKEVVPVVFPDRDDINQIVEQARACLMNLDFESKKSIVDSIVEKVVGNKSELTVTGYIPFNYIKNSYVTKCTIYRNCRPAERGQINVI